MTLLLGCIELWHWNFQRKIPTNDPICRTMSSNLILTQKVRKSTNIVRELFQIIFIGMFGFVATTGKPLKFVSIHYLCVLCLFSVCLLLLGSFNEYYCVYGIPRPKCIESELNLKSILIHALSLSPCPPSPFFLWVNLRYSNAIYSWILYSKEKKSLADTQTLLVFFFFYLSPGKKRNFLPFVKKYLVYSLISSKSVIVK